MAQDPQAAKPDVAAPTEEKKSASNEAPIVRDLDIVIYGATGFTGQYLAKYLASRCATSDDLNDLKWGIAGRNETKLRTLHNVIKETYTQALPSKSTTKTKDDLNSLALLIGDVTKLDELKRIVRRTKLIISCVGPYRFYGENVVKACAENGTHYVDICGEPEFMERCAFKYFKTANDNNSIICNACGFDSIPSDMGSEFLNQLYLKNGALCSNIEVYMTFSVPKGYPGHVTTFEAAVHGFGGVDELRSLRKELSKVEWRHGRKNILRVGPKQKIHKETYFWSDNVKRYSMIFPFADSAVVSNSQGIRSSLLLNNYGIKRTFPQFAAYLSFNSKMATYQAVAIGGFSTLLTKFEWGRSLLLSYPEAVTMGSFTHAGPTEEQMDATTFSAKMFGQGYSKETLDRVKETLSKNKTNENENESKNENENKKEEIDETDELRKALANEKPDLLIETSVDGCDPGYKATAIMSIESALCLVSELETIRKGNLELGIPGIKGGVFTPSAVFGATALPEKLTKVGLEFKIIKGLPNASASVSASASANANDESKQSS